MSEERIELVKNLVELAINEHSDAQANFSSLDTKAQNTTAIAGIFLAGALAFFNGASLQKLMTIGSHATIVLLALVIVSLMFCTAFCLWAMRIRDVSIGDVGFAKEVVVGSSGVAGILDLPADELRGRYENYLLTQAGDWTQNAKSLRDINDQKARAVRRGQTWLGVSILFVAALLLYTSFKLWRFPEAAKPESTQVERGTN